jgi:uncharacterized RDD family membrane protein YckC
MTAVFCLEIRELFCYHVRVSRAFMRKADLTTRAVAAFVDLLIIIALVRLPDVIGFLAAAGYLLVKDGLFERQSIGKKAIGLRVQSSDSPETAVSYRESIIRNVPLAAAFLLFFIPYAGWVLGPLALAIEALTALGDERGMRIGDIIARTVIVQTAASAGNTAADAMAQQPDFGAPPENGVQRDND